MKIGPVDHETALLILKKEEINASKIYSLVGNLAERAKKRKISKVPEADRKTLESINQSICQQEAFEKCWAHSPL